MSLLCHFHCLFTCLHKDDADEDETCIDQLIEETNKEQPDKARLANLQKKTFRFRKLEKKIYPFLLEEKFVSFTFVLK